ncbi:MAG: WG repeat-containing protein [Chitinophagaceae bacterium]
MHNRHFKKIVPFFAALSLLGQTNAIYAQNDKTNNSIKKVGSLLGGILNKKDTKTTTKSPTTTTSTSSNTIQLNNKNFIEGGTIAPNAKYLDVDRWSAFNNGAAVVHKGMAAALINSNGDFIVPYSAGYEFFSEATELEPVVTSARNIPQRYYVNDIFYYMNINHTGVGGYINSKGKLLANRTDQYTNYLFDYTANKKYIFYRRKIGSKVEGGVSYDIMRYVYVDTSGKEYVYDHELTDIFEGIGIVTARNNRSKKGYRTLTGKMLTGYQYDEANPFSDGMAIVGVRDQYGQVKYGAIDRNGKLAVPLMYSNRPSAFSGGYATVKPQDSYQAGFEYGFIDKKGNLVFKQTKEDIAKNGGTFGPFSNFGLSYSGKYIMDTAFHIKSKADFFASYGLPENCWFADQSENTGTWTENDTHPKVYFGHNKIKDPYTRFGLRIIGFIDLVTGKVVKPAFTKIGRFDPVSRLAYAEIITGVKSKDNPNPVYKDGFINEDGAFVLLKQEKGTW